VKRFISLLIAVAAAAAVVVAVTGASAGAAGGSLPTLNIALTGKSGVSVSENTIPSGAVNVVTTFSGKGHGDVAILRLNDGVTPQQAFNAVQKHHGDLNALDPFGTVIVEAPAPGKLQTVLSPSDNYYAVNATANAPAVAKFNVHQNPTPAALPKADSTQKAIEFGFKGSKTLTDGKIVRAKNSGFLVHMINLVGAKGKKAAHKIAAGLREGVGFKKLHRFATGQFVSLQEPVSPGGLQQFKLHAKPGFYVEACFMDTQDGREHTQLGMERVVRVVK
jgi:hypothetical protein